MKRSLFILCAIMLCLVCLFGCSNDQVKSYASSSQEFFCQVHCFKEDGMVVEVFDISAEDYSFDHLKNADGEYIGYVYVQYENKDLDIDPLDTVVIKFALSELIPASGTFVDFFDAEQPYSYILENPKNVRLTNEGEPTFG